jgi:hypothetical protein
MNWGTAPGAGESIANAGLDCAPFKKVKPFAVSLV